MLMNDDINDIKNDDLKQHRSPLRNDSRGRFSRKGEIVDHVREYLPFFDTSLAVLFSLFLVAIDLFLFAGSGSIKIFNNSFLPIPELMLIFGAFALLFAFIGALLHHNSAGKAIFVAVCAFFFVFGIYNQFSQTNRGISIGMKLMSPSIIIGVVFAVFVFIIYLREGLLPKILLTLVPIVLFFNICFSLSKRDTTEFIIFTSESATKPYGANQRLVYIILPHFVNHNLIRSWQTPEAEQTYKLAEDFYKINQFKVFNNAYVETYDYFENLIMFLNSKANKNNLKKYILSTKAVSGNWQFSNLIDDNINLKSNELYDYLGKNGYNISAYKSRNIDLCHKNHEMNVKRCVEKVNSPTNIYDTNQSLLSRTSILFMEWFFSLRISNRMMSYIEYLSKSFNMELTPEISVIYNNIYAVNTTKFFDILYDNIKSDKGKQAYFVFADIPSDMYIYDEFCRIRPKNEWIDLINLPWVDKDYTEDRRESYIQQYRCLYGKMQQFIENLSKYNLLKDTKIIFVGASNLNNFQNVSSNDFGQRFIENNLVNMAIFDGSNPKFEKDDTICSIRSLMMKELFGIDQCGKIENLQDFTLIGLKRSLKKLNNQEPVQTQIDYRKWYSKWKEANAK